VVADCSTADRDGNLCSFDTLEAFWFQGVVS